MQNAGPYLLVELLLPGGTLIALLLWVSQNFKPLQDVKGPNRAAVVAVQTLLRRRSA
jgi:hypothetical protein